MNCRHCGKPIGYVTDDPNYQAIGGYVHHPEDGPDSYLDCGDEYGTQAEPDTPVFCKCGDETCTHGGCRDPHCKNFCHQCQRERDAAREAAYQRDVAGPLLARLCSICDAEFEGKGRYCGECLEQYGWRPSAEQERQEAREG